MFTKNVFSKMKRVACKQLQELAK